MTDLRRVTVVFASTLLYKDPDNFPQEVVEGSLPDIVGCALHEYRPTVGSVGFEGDKEFVASVRSTHEFVMNVGIRTTIPLEGRLEHVCREQVVKGCEKYPTLEYYSGAVESWEFGVDPDPGYFGPYSMRHWTKSHILKGAKARGATGRQLYLLSQIPLKDLQAMFLIPEGTKAAGWIDGDRNGKPGRRTAYYSLDTDSILNVGEKVVR